MNEKKKEQKVADARSELWSLFRKDGGAHWVGFLYNLIHSSGERSVHLLLS
jgi:hypothetical protein